MRLRNLVWLAVLAALVGCGEEEPEEAVVITDAATVVVDEGETEPAEEPAEREVVTGALDYDKYGVHALFDQILSDHVEDGLVAYDAIAADPRWPEYLAALADADLSLLRTPANRAGFYINAWNAFVIEGILSNARDGEYVSPADIADDPGQALTTFFEVQTHQLAGRPVTLEYIRDVQLRQNLGDPRIHAALNYGATSGPVLEQHAFPLQQELLDIRLDSAMRRFLRDPRRNSIDPGDRTIELSEIFRWFLSDWIELDSDVSELRDFLSEYVDAEQAQFVVQTEIPIEYQPFQWRLNGASTDLGSPGAGVPAE